METIRTEEDHACELGVIISQPARIIYDIARRDPEIIIAMMLQG